MRNELENYIRKYGTLENFNVSGTQQEKDDYLLTERSIIVSYDDHFLQAQHNLDNRVNYIMNNLQDEDFYFFRTNDPLFSLYSKVKFEGETNLYNPESYMCSLPDKANFTSLYQYLIYHKAILFLDRRLASNILLVEKKDELIPYAEEINRIDKGVWCKYRIDIAEKGIRHILNSNVEFKSRLIDIKNRVFVFIDENPFWGVNKDQIDTLNLTRKNYLGKMLTQIKSEYE